MATYYFDTAENGNVTRDDIGIELGTDEEVRDEAIRCLPGLAEEQLPDGSEHSFWVKVRDGSGAYIFYASLDMKSHWLRANQMT